MMDLDAYPIFRDHKSTLRELSKDDHDPENIQYMTDSQAEAVAFDDVKTQYANDLGLSEESAASVDALISLADGVWFIEFKNGAVNKRQVKDKARDSLLLFLDTIGKTIAFSRENMDLIVVYNLERNPLPHQAQRGQPQESPSRLAIAEHFLERGGEELIRFDLGRYRRLYFRDVHTYSGEQFEAYRRAAGL